MNTMKLRLVRPSMEYLPEFREALTKGWSPNTTRDVTAEMLAEIAAGEALFVDNINASHVGRTITLPDGLVMQRLPALTLWMWDGAFCGSINLRHMEGTNDLPLRVPGHIGYAVVPWKRQRGYASEALRQFLPEARKRGLTEVKLTSDVENVASHKVIMANGGRLLGPLVDENHAEGEALLFAIAL